MKKFLVFPILLIIAPIIAAMYGILHDQLTYSISSEYYTKFKFIQFGLIENETMGVSQPRVAVAYVGVLATWWMGIPTGIILTTVGLIHVNGNRMLIVTLKAFLVAVIVTFLTGLIGLGYGYLFLSKMSRSEFQNWFLPETLVDFRNYIAVGSMHNFSYLGGIAGLFAGIVYIIGKSSTVGKWCRWMTVNQLNN
jgi:hypothetical protein